MSSPPPLDSKLSIYLLNAVTLLIVLLLLLFLGGTKGGCDWRSSRFRTALGEMYESDCKLLIHQNSERKMENGKGKRGLDVIQ